MASEGDYTKCRAYAWKNKEFIKRVTKTDQKRSYGAWKANMKNLESHMVDVQQSEVEDGVCLSDDDDDTSSHLFAEAPTASPTERRKTAKAKKKALRRGGRSDTAANAIFQLRGAKDLFD